jgi:GntR family transcriptional repressor for pyruvate dehydrogenase complex
MLLAQPDGMRLFQDARALFEVGLARLAAERATDADVAELAEALEANRRAIGDPEAFKRTDVAFHYRLAEIARNPIFTAICEAVAEWLTEQRTTSGRAPQSSKLAFAAHKRVFEAVAARDPDAAQAAMQQHLDTVAKLYWKVRSEATAGAA